MVGPVLFGAALGCGSGGRAAVLDEPAGAGGRADSGLGSGGRGSIGGAGARDGGVNDGSADGPDAVAKADGASKGGSGPTDAGCQPVEMDIVPPVEAGAAVCVPDSAWGAATPLPTASTPEDDVLGSITPGELTIAWMSMKGDTPTLYYADRDSPEGAFYPAGNLSLGQTYYAAERPALSADGTRIIVVRTDRRGFGEYTRTSRFATFTNTPSEASFAAINNQGTMLLANQYFGDPVLSSDDLTFYYSLHHPLSVTTILSVGRATPFVPWLTGSPVLGEPLRASCGRRKRPTGISTDQLTLFYWDEISGSERATFRSAIDAPFVGAVDLGARAQAQPNAACNRLYFSAPAADAASGDDIVFASR